MLAYGLEDQDCRSAADHQSDIMPMYGGSDLQICGTALLLHDLNLLTLLLT